MLDFGRSPKLRLRRKGTKSGSRKNMDFLKILPENSRTISDEKSDSVQKTTHKWFAKNRIISYFDCFGHLGGAGPAELAGSISAGLAQNLNRNPG